MPLISRSTIQWKSSPLTVFNQPCAKGRVANAIKQKLQRNSYFISTTLCSIRIALDGFGVLLGRPVKSPMISVRRILSYLGPFPNTDLRLSNRRTNAMKQILIGLTSHNLSGFCFIDFTWKNMSFNAINLGFVSKWD